MRQIVANRTVIIIAHRLAAVRDCHRIIAMEDGRIAESGTPAELLRRPGGLYRRLWDLQNEGAGTLDAETSGTETSGAKTSGAKTLDGQRVREESRA